MRNERCGGFPAQGKRTGEVPELVAGHVERLDRDRAGPEHDRRDAGRHGRGHPEHILGPVARQRALGLWPVAALRVQALVDRRHHVGLLACLVWWTRPNSQAGTCMCISQARPFACFQNGQQMHTSQHVLHGQDRLAGFSALSIPTRPKQRVSAVVWRRSEHTVQHTRKMLIMLVYSALSLLTPSDRRPSTCMSPSTRIGSWRRVPARDTKSATPRLPKR